MHYLSLDRPKECLEIAPAAAEVSPDDPLIQALVVASEVGVGRRSPAAGRAVLKRIIHAYPDLQFPRDVLGHLLLLDGEFREAKAVVRELMKERGSVVGLALLARIQFLEGSYADAQRSILEIEERDGGLHTVALGHTAFRTAVHLRDKEGARRAYAYLARLRGHPARMWALWLWYHDAFRFGLAIAIWGLGVALWNPWLIGVASIVQLVGCWLSWHFVRSRRALRAGLEIVGWAWVIFLLALLLRSGFI